MLIVRPLKYHALSHGCLSHVSLGPHFSTCWYDRVGLDRAGFPSRLNSDLGRPLLYPGYVPAPTVP